MIIRFGLDERRETLLINSDGAIFRLRKGEETFIVKNTEVWENAVDWASENADTYLDSIPYEITEDMKSVFYILLENGLLESVHSLVEGSKKSLGLFTLEDGELVPFSLYYDTMKYKGIIADNFSDLGTEPYLWFKNSDGFIVPCENMIKTKVSKSTVSISLESNKDDGCWAPGAVESDHIDVDDFFRRIDAGARPSFYSPYAVCTNKACCNEVCPIEDCSTEPAVTEPAVTEPAVTEPVVTEPVVTEPVVTEPVVTEPVVTEPEVTEPSVTEPSVTEPSVTEPSVTEPVVTESAVTNSAVTESAVTEPAVTEPVVVADTKTKFCLTRNNACSIQ